MKILSFPIERFQKNNYNERNSVIINRMAVFFMRSGGRKPMVFLGDYFALGLVIVLCMFYFDGKTSSHYMSDASKCFIACLVLTALPAVTDLLTGQLKAMNQVPLWLNMAVNTLYFLVNIITTSAFALFLFTKILEHTHDHHCMAMARRGLVLLLFSTCFWWWPISSRDGCSTLTPQGVTAAAP